MDDPRGRDDWLALAELALLLVLSAYVYHQEQNPARLLAWIFGALPERPHAFLAPWLALLRGLANLTLALAVVAAFGARRRWSGAVRTVAGAGLVLMGLVIPTLIQIELRAHVDEVPGNDRPYVSRTHDGGVAQTEMAVDALLDGQNPYTIAYDRPPMSRTADSQSEGWQALGYEANPAFHHFPYLPGVLYVVAPVQWAARTFVGLWDVRFVYLAAALAIAALLGALVPRGPPRRMVWLVTLVSPLLGPFVVVGRNDALVLLALAAFAHACARNRPRTASVALGVALTLKQFAIFAVVPFAIALIRQRGWRAAARAAWPTVALPAIAALPFLIWDPRSFLRDVLLWNLGSGNDAYPVRWDGFGLTPLAYGLGLVDAPSGPNPYGFFLPLAILVGGASIVRWLWGHATPRRVLAASGAWIYIALFASRFFADNYLAIPCLFLGAALLAPDA